MTRTLYFAYGSNTDSSQMLKRCPSAQKLHVAELSNHRLRFAGTSCLWNGGGVADIQPHKAPGSSVFGVLWSITSEDLITLDRYEGHPHAYKRCALQVELSNGESVITWVYAKPASSEQNGPSQSYVDALRRGYREADIELSQLTIAVNRCPEQAPDHLVNVFVYGSLMSGMCNSAVMKGSVFDRDAEIDGLKMVSMGSFPACFEGPDVVPGEVWRVPSRQLRRLDMLEGHPNFYRRRQRATIEGLIAWVYLLDEPPVRHRGPVHGSCWRSHVQAKACTI